MCQGVCYYVCVFVLDAQTPLKSNEKMLSYIGSVDQEEEIVGGRFWQQARSSHIIVTSWSISYSTLEKVSNYKCEQT